MVNINFFLIFISSIIIISIVTSSIQLINKFDKSKNKCIKLNHKCDYNNNNCCNTLICDIIQQKCKYNSEPEPIPQNSSHEPNIDFEEIQGLSGPGYCKVNNQANSNWWQVKDTKENPLSLKYCKELCKNDPKCLAINYNSTENKKECQLFTSDETPKDASINYKSSYNDIFPTYSSPWLCDLPLQEDKRNNNFCLYKFGYNSSQCELTTDNVKCFKKIINKKKSYLGYNLTNINDYNVYDNDIGITYVVSNPFLYKNELYKTPNTFYNWFINMLKNSTVFITLINVYFMLGKWESDDPTNYQNIIYWEILNAANRGVKINIIYSKLAEPTELDCLDALIEQYKNNKNLKKIQNINFKSVNFFFHDKIYISDKECYIGGQNMSGSSSIDFGVGISSFSSLYQDIKERSTYFLNKTNGINKPFVFKYTYNNPFITKDNIDYFISLSPFNNICNVRPKKKVFPQSYIDFTKNPKVGGYNNNSLSRVSYEWWHLYDLINNAKKFIKITNFDFSLFSSGLSQCGYDIKMQKAIENAISKKVDIEMWLHNQPMADSMPNNPNSMCGMLICPNTKKLIDTWTKTGNFKINYWYTNPYIDNYPPCKLLHAKIYYSDYGVLISSSNFVPDYWANTSNTGLCVRFNDGNIPKWIINGVQEVLDILNKNKKHGKYTCNNKTPNFDLEGAPCGFTSDGSYLCSSTCSTCSKLSDQNVPVCTNCLM